MPQEFTLAPTLTERDEAESAEGGIDPLGLYTIADALGVKLVPGIRKRLTHPRSVTAMAVSLDVCREFDNALGAMAEADTEKLDALLREVHTGQEMLSQVAQEAGVVPADDGDKEPAGIPDRFTIMASIGCPIRWRLQCPSNGTSDCYLFGD